MNRLQTIQFRSQKCTKFLYFITTKVNYIIVWCFEGRFDVILTNLQQLLTLYEQMYELKNKGHIKPYFDSVSTSTEIEEMLSDTIRH